MNYRYNLVKGLIILTSFLLACNNKKRISVAPSTQSADIAQVITKPGSSFTDSLQVNKPSAIFYMPDSVQLQKIEALTDKGIFESMMHEYEYQIRNSKIEINKNFPKLIITEPRNIRWLLFQKNNGQKTIVDLNSKNDACGLFLFEPGQDPRYADMMNIETELPRYFGHQ
jgi:hypothetical protein